MIAQKLKRAFRIATLVVPSWIAWCVAFSAPHKSALAPVVTVVLGPLWGLLAALLAVRATALVVRRANRERGEGPGVLERLDLLTASGSALAWSSAFAIMGAVWIGWASLAAVGLLGSGVFHIVALFAFAAAGGPDPLRGAKVARRFSPGAFAEGDDVIEEIEIAGVQIPIGFRMFVTGRIGPRWATSRHVLESVDSGSEVILEAEVGPAVRGEHAPEPLEVWLEDVFGLFRSVRARVADEGSVVVLPKLLSVDRRVSLLDHGIGPRAPQRAVRLPTEGAFDLKEYKPGDDVRRIHWTRSVATGQLVVRKPDEIPPDRPKVRLVLDTFFPDAFALTCDAPAELLDAVVGVWLALARSLAESGVRVTLVAGVVAGEKVVPKRHDVSLRAFGAALRFGAEIGWQNRMPVEELFTGEATLVVARGVLTHPSACGAERWVIVLPEISPAFPWPFSDGASLPYPPGSSDNRWLRRREAKERFSRMRTDHAKAMLVMQDNVVRPPPGSLTAGLGQDGTVSLEVLA